MEADMEVDNVADMVVDMEVDMVVNMREDKNVYMADMVAGMKVTWWPTW